MENKDIFEADEEQKKALSRKRIFAVLVGLNIIMVLLILWEIVELFFI